MSDGGRGKWCGRVCCSSKDGKVSFVTICDFFEDFESGFTRLRVLKGQRLGQAFMNCYMPHAIDQEVFDAPNDVAKRLICERYCA